MKHLATDRRFEVQKVVRGTSRFLLKALPMEPQVFRTRLQRANIILPPAADTVGRFRLQVNPTILRMTPECLAQAFREALDEGS